MNRSYTLSGARGLLFGLCVALLALLLAGCGGAANNTATSDEEATTAEADEAPATTEDEEPAATEADEANIPVPVNGELTNQGAGFVIRPPDGWVEATSDGAGGYGTTTVVPPESLENESIGDFVFISINATEEIAESLEDVDDTADLTLEDVQQWALTGAPPDTSTTDTEETDIAGTDALATNITFEDPNVGEVQGRLITALLEDNRVIMMIGLMQSDTWQQSTFDQIADSMRLIEPAAVEFDLSDDDTMADSERPYEIGQTEEGFYYKGDSDAPVEVVEYSDFQCPACGSFATSDIYTTLTENYVAEGDVQFVYHDFPLSYHQNAPLAAQAAYCAGDQESYWAMHDLLFATQQDWSSLPNGAARDLFIELAEALNLDSDAFETCLAEDTYVEFVDEALAASMEADIQATPTFIVNGESVTAGELLAAIDAELEGTEEE